MKIPVSESTVINNDVDMPSLYNGKEYSYSVWFYVDSVSTGNPKMILYRGNNSTNLQTATPIFYMSGDYVKLNVLVKTNKEAEHLPEGANRASLNNLDAIQGCDFVRMSVDYVPMQRWVNAILVVDNEFVQLFFDGELIAVTDVSEKVKFEGTYEENQTCNGTNDNTSLCCDDRLVGMSSEGKNVYIGAPNQAGADAIDGYISKVQFFNYAVTLDHAKVIYQAGPLHLSILNMIGLPLIGIRNPFYQIDSVKQTE